MAPPTSSAGPATPPTHLAPHPYHPSGNTIDLNGADSGHSDRARRNCLRDHRGRVLATRSVLTTITPAGIATVSATITGYLSGNVAIRSDGTAYYTTYTDGPGGTVTTHVHIIGTTTVIDIPGQPSGGVYVAPDGSVLHRCRAAESPARRDRTRTGRVGRLRAAKGGASAPGAMLSDKGEKFVDGVAPSTSREFVPCGCTTTTHERSRTDTVQTTASHSMGRQSGDTMFAGTLTTGAAAAGEAA